jgi:hypothetical protein
MDRPESRERAAHVAGATPEVEDAAGLERNPSASGEIHDSYRPASVPPVGAHGAGSSVYRAVHLWLASNGSTASVGMSPA